VAVERVEASYILHPELGQQQVQRVAHEFAEDELPGPDDDDRHMGQPCGLGGDGGPEVHLVAHDDVRSPRPAQFEHRLGAGPAETGDEVVGYTAALLIKVVHDQRRMDRLQVGPCCGERQSPGRSVRGQRRSTGDEHVVSGLRRMLRQRQQRLQMTVTPGCCEEDASRSSHQAEPTEYMIRQWRLEVAAREEHLWRDTRHPSTRGPA
jgi:hypothetical protein